MVIKSKFDITYPLSLLSVKKLSLDSASEKRKNASRNIYFESCGINNENLILDNYGYFRKLSEKVVSYLDTNYPHLNLLNVSLFGSALFLKEPNDYDFLAIVSGDAFINDEIESFVDGGTKRVRLGVSIKGLDVLEGRKKPEVEGINGRMLEQIIDRTTVSLPYRNLTTWGYAFNEDLELFLRNAPALAYDLLDNTERIFVSDKNPRSLSNEIRSKKILSRCYQAVTYISKIKSTLQVQRLRTKIYNTMFSESENKLDKSKSIFGDTVEIYEATLMEANKND